MTFVLSCFTAALKHRTVGEFTPIARVVKGGVRGSPGPRVALGLYFSLGFGGTQPSGAPSKVTNSVFVALLLLAILLLLYGALLPPLHLLHFPHLCLDTRQILPQTHSQVVVAAAVAVTAVAVAVLTFMMGGGGRAGGIVTAAGFAKDTAAPTCG